MAADASEESKPPTPGPPTKEEVLADPRYHELLAGYQPLHNSIFLESYARLLADLHRNGEVYESNLEYLLHQHDKVAYKALWIVQHQKLFDLECQWRAELVEVPGARITADFEDWHQYIEECPVVPPIAPDELELLIAYLGRLDSSRDIETGNPAHTYWLQRRYPHMRPNPDDPDDDHDEPLTDFTEFWDLHRGTGYLRELPDRRGEREFRYEKAVQKEHRRLHPHMPAPEDPRPYVPTYGPEYDDIVRDWLRRFEPAARLRQFETKRQLEAFDASEDRLDLPLALERLQNAGNSVSIPIEAHADWRQAVIAAGHRHYFNQLIAALPHVYEDYSQRVALGIALAAPDDGAHRYNERGDCFARHEALIREGRRLLGEPDDLNF
ncbi:MAG: hypothetical protein JWP58_4513 [Hymenobacter sp.]|nr:hypothetical protein [Hymenobacter sp.]